MPSYFFVWRARATIGVTGRCGHASIDGRPHARCRRAGLGVNSPRERIFNVPAVVLAVLAACAVVHAVRVLLLSPEADQEFMLRFAFIPARLDAAIQLPGGDG